MVNRYNNRMDYGSDSVDESIGLDLSRHLKPEPTTPIDRRTFLAVLGVLGISASTGFSIYRAARPMPMAEISASDFVMPNNQRVLINSLSRLDTDLVRSTQSFLQTHQALFDRRVRVEWEERRTRQVEQCSGVGEDRSCWYTTETYWTNESASETVYADRYLSTGENQSAIRERYSMYRKFGGALSDFARNNMHEIYYHPESYSTRLDDLELSQNFGFEWAEGEVRNTSKAFITAAIGVPMTAIGVFYNQIASFVKNRLISNHRHSWYRKKRKEEDEVNLTRRSFMLALTGIGVGGVVSGIQNSIQEHNAEVIVDQGKSDIRGVVSDIQTMSPEQLFRAHTGFYWRELISVLDAQIANLNSLTIESVDSAVRQGLAELDNAERRCTPLGFGVRSVRTTLKEDNYNPSDISNYIEAARALSVRLQNIRNRLASIYDNDLLDTVAPAMRASHLTNRLNEITANQNRAHLKGLAWDMAFMYGSIYGLMVMSEFSPEFNQGSYTFVQRVFDAIDKMRMDTYDVFLSLQESSKGFYSKLKLDREVNNLLNNGISSLEDDHMDFISDEFVNPLVDSDVLLGQIKKLDRAKIVEHYFNKALTYFANKRMTASDTFKSLFVNRDFDDDAVQDVDFDEVKEKVLVLMQSSVDSGNFFIDLLNAGLLDDGYDDKLWFQVPMNKLDIMIKNKARRLEVLFKAMQSDWVSLNMLPVEWSMVEVDPNAVTLTAQDFIDAVEKMLIENSDSTEIKLAIDKLDSVNDRVLDHSTRSKYLMLKTLGDYLAVGGKLEELLVYIPKFKNAMQQVVETDSARSFLD